MSSMVIVLVFKLSNAFSGDFKACICIDTHSCDRVLLYILRFYKDVIINYCYY